MNRVQALLENSSFIHCRFAPSLHPVVDMKGLGDIYKYVVFIDIVVSSANQDRYGSRLIIQAAEYLHATGSVIVIRSRNPMFGFHVMQITIADKHTAFGRVAPVINRSLVVYFLADMMDIAIFDYVVVSVKQDSHAGGIVNFAMGGFVSNTVQRNTRPVGAFYAVKVVNTAVLHVIECRGKRRTAGLHPH